jgi:hypothetical protein
MATIKINSKEYNRIKQAAKNNECELSKLKLHDGQPQPPEKDHNPQKWIKFTYSVPQIRTLTKVFKHTNLRIAYSVK